MNKQTKNPASKKQQPQSQPKSKPKAAGNRNQPRKGLKPAQGGSETAPVAVSNKQSFPLRGMGARKSWRFANSELVGSVLNSTGFVATKYYVNPGMPGSFPWLSVESQKWDQHRFHFLRYRYVTRCGTSTVGSVILSPEYNVRDPSPVSEVQATDTQDAVEDAPWKEICCELDIAAMYPSGPRKLIRSGNVAGDTNLYDAALFYICTTEGANTDMIGKLWVDYDVELFVPQNSPLEGSVSLVTSFGGKAASQAYTTGVAAPVSYDPLTQDPLGIGIPTVGVFTPAAGTYLIHVDLTFMDTSAETFTVTFEIQKNGASLTPPSNFLAVVTNPANGQVSGSCDGVVAFNGTTDTLRVIALVSGAAGTLSIPVTSSYLTIRPA